MEESQPTGAVVEPPLGMYPSRVDEKGRLKLPKDFEEYFKSLQDQRFFVTSLDGSIARVYPMEVWRQNLRLLEDDQDNPELAEAIAYHADYWGAISPMDSQGRVLVPPELRRKLGLENQAVRVRFYKGAVDIVLESAAEKRVQDMEPTLGDALKALRRKGLK